MMKSLVRSMLMVPAAALIVGPAAAREPTPARMTAGSIAAEDYPDAALSSGEAGTVIARFVVAPDGRVRDCTSTAETAAPTLQLWTCFLLSERFRYTPARDQNGKPISEEKVQRVTWRLPGVAAPVAPARAPLRPFTSTIEFTVSAEGDVSDCTTAAGSIPTEFKAPDVCERLRTVVPFTDAAGRAVARRVTLINRLEVGPAD